jgi:UDP-N-acetylglucosamine 2-epimerase
MKETVIIFKYLLTQCIMKKYSHLHLSVSKERANYLRNASVSGRRKHVIGNPEWTLII